MQHSSRIEAELLGAASRILAPLVRASLRNGVTSDALTEVVRHVFVRVASEEFGLEDRRPTQARISVLTGLHRKEVSRLLRKQGEARSETPERRNRAASVLAAWLRDPDFHDAAGVPRPLPLTGDRSFSELCKRHSGDMKPGSVAEELLATGALEEVEGLLHMTSRGYVPGKDPIELVRILGTDTAELLETIDHNIQAEPPARRYQCKVKYDNVPEDCAPEFLRHSAQRSQELLEELDAWLAERDLGDQPCSPTDDVGRRVSLGLGAFQIMGESPFSGEGRATTTPGSETE